MVFRSKWMEKMNSKLNSRILHLQKLRNVLIEGDISNFIVEWVMDMIKINFNEEKRFGNQQI